MDRFKKMIISILTFMLGLSPVWAVCDTSETNQLRSEAMQVKASYEVLTRILDPSEYNPPDGTEVGDPDYVEMADYFKIYITNVTENLYVSVYDDLTEETKVYNYQDGEEGTITFDVYKLGKITKYTISVYSAEDTNCPDTKLYELSLTTPRYNSDSELSICSGASDFYLCYKYVKTDAVDFDTLVSSVNNYKAGKINNQGEEINPNVEEEPTFGNFLSEHIVPIVIISVVLVALIWVVVVIIIKKKRSKQNEEEV